MESATGVAAPATARPLGLAVGAPAPAFRLGTTAGGEVALDDLLADGPVALVFTAPRCDACTELLPDLAAAPQPGRPRVVVIGAGPAAANAAKAREGGLDRILLDARRKVAEAYAAPGTPAAVIVSTDGRIASPVAMGVDPVRDLLRGHAHHHAHAHGHQPAHGQGQVVRRITRAVGTAAPVISLPALHGGEVAVGAATGHDTLLLFFDPACGFCQRMLPDLHALEAAPPPGAPPILVVSRGAADATRALGLASPAVLDLDGEAFERYGMPGTPSAVLLDGHGAIASEPAPGATAVLDLLRRHHPALETAR